MVYTYDESGEPFRQYLWWRVIEARGTGYGERPEAGDVATSKGGGVWRTRNPRTHRSTGSVSTGAGHARTRSREGLVGLAPGPRRSQIRVNAFYGCLGLVGGGLLGSPGPPGPRRRTVGLEVAQDLHQELAGAAPVNSDA